jgi:hypothetical protein
MYPLYSCRVADRADGRILVEHVELDSNFYQLSVTEGRKRIWIEHPLHIIPLLPHVHEDSIRFDRTDKSYLLVNGIRFPITVVSKADGKSARPEDFR